MVTVGMARSSIAAPELPLQARELLQILVMLVGSGCHESFHVGVFAGLELYASARQSMYVNS